MKDHLIIKSLKGELSFTLIFPVSVATELGVDNSDLLDCIIEGNRLTISKLKQVGVARGEQNE
jgi:hypothetical protein